MDVVITSNKIKFADDTKRGKSIKKSRRQSSFANRSSQLNVIWSLILIKLCKGSKIGSLIDISFKLNNIDIIESQCERDLRVLISVI